jgi:hypothetical protein
MRLRIKPQVLKKDDVQPQRTQRSAGLHKVFLRGLGGCCGSFITPATIAVVAASTVIVRAHSGPPFPIVSNRLAGPYDISVWTDPDATSDGSAAGQFWVMLRPATGSGSLPAGTHATVSITALDRLAPVAARQAQPVDNEISRQFAALVMDHEGRFGVRVTVDGPLGRAAVDASVDATYDLRPSRAMMVVYLTPFVVVGFLWVKLLVRRRATQTRN